MVGCRCVRIGETDGTDVTGRTATAYNRRAIVVLALMLALASPLACLLQCHLYDLSVRAVSSEAHFICPLGDAGHAAPAPDHQPTIQALHELLHVAATVLPMLLLAAVLLSASIALLRLTALPPLTPPPRSF